MSHLAIPADRLGDDPDSTWARNWWATGYGSRGLPLAGPTKWCIPNYTATSTTPLISVYRNPAVSGEPVRWESVPTFAADNWRYPDNSLSVKVPWRDVWKVADGTDGMVIVHRRDGSRFEILNLRRQFFGLWGRWECDRMHLVTDACNPETHTATGAGGLSQLDGLLTAKMIDDGVIPTALAIASRNVQYGPGATSLSTHRVEHPTGPGAKQRASQGLQAGQAAGMNPGGFRLRVDITDAQIDQWLDSRGHTGTIRRTARIIAIALRDFGMEETTTCDQQPYIVTTGAVNPDEANRWRANGITTNTHWRTLLDGFCTVDRLKVVNHS